MSSRIGLIVGLLAGTLVWSESANAQMALPGSFAVSEGGAATYDIPIDVPPGTAGMEPKLSLTYSSSGGNGLLGVGWALSGLSQISRCAQTVATDGQHGGVNYDADDRFCLNGDLLVAISGSYGADGTEYRTQSEGFSRIVSHGPAGNGPASFTVWTKAGLKMEFGHTADSRIEAIGTSTPRLWSLNRVQDTIGNAMIISYVEDNQNGGYYPDVIEYTENTSMSLAALASVKFEYELNPNIDAVYRGGSVVVQTLRLKTIKTFVGVSQVLQYNLEYTDSALTSRSFISKIEKCAAGGSCLPETVFTTDLGTGLSYADISNVMGADGFYHPHGLTVADFNGDGLADIYWDYQDTTGRSVGNPRYIWMGQGDGTFTVISDALGISGQYAKYQPVIGDFNGDGNADIMLECTNLNGLTYLHNPIFESNGDGTFTQSVHGTTCIGPEAGYSYQTRLGDFDGDGKTDIFFFGSLPNGRAQGISMFIRFGNGLSTMGAAPTGRIKWAIELEYGSGTYNGWVPHVADFNGDGLADILWDRSNTVWTGLSDGTRHLWLGRGDGTFERNINPGNTQGSAANYAPYIGDFNGDGAADILWDQKDNYFRSTGYRILWTGKGDGNFDGNSNPASQNGQNQYYAPSLADFNGDGRTDILWDYKDVHGRSYGYRDIWLSKGDGPFGSFSVHPNVAGANGVFQNHLPRLADFNGDGASDFLWSHTDTIGRSAAGGRVLWLSQHTSNEAVTSISNGLGSTSHIEYASLSETGAPYTKDSGANAASYPEMDIHAPAYVVSELRADDGIGGVTTTRYRYGGLKYDHELRQALGFRWREVEQVEAQVVKRTEYRQDFPFIGMTELSQTRVLALDGLGNPQGQAGTNLVRESSSTYACRDFVGAPGCDVAPNRRYYVYQASSTERGWDLDGSELPETETASTYDDYGNALTVDVTVTDKPSAPTEVFTKNTTNTYAPPNLTDWIHGRLTRAEVTSTAP